MLSKTKLFAALAEIAPDRWPVAPTSMMNETYGRKSMIYVGCGTQQGRAVIEAALKERGFKVSANYAPGAVTTEVQVSYFKGTRWDE